MICMSKGGGENQHFKVFSGKGKLAVDSALTRHHGKEEEEQQQYRVGCQLLSNSLQGINVEGGEDGRGKV